VIARKLYQKLVPLPGWHGEDALDHDTAHLQAKALQSSWSTSPLLLQMAVANATYVMLLSYGDFLGQGQVS